MHAHMMAFLAYPIAAPAGIVRAQALRALSPLALRFLLKSGVARTFWRIQPPRATHLRVCVDASPWGIGGTLVQNGAPP